MAAKKKTKPAKKKAVKKPAKKKAPATRAKAPKAAKPIGVVTHFYTAIKVAIVKFKKPVRTGTELHYKGATTDFKEIAKSMQFDHEVVKVAPKGKQIGIKVKKRVRDGDEVYEG